MLLPLNLELHIRYGGPHILATSRIARLTDQLNSINTSIDQRMPGLIIGFQLIPRLSRLPYSVDGVRYNAYKLEFKSTGLKIARR